MPNNERPPKQTEDTSRFGTAFAPDQLEAEDKEALEIAYVNSYRYTKSQRIAGLIAVFVVLGLVIWGVVTLFMSIIDLIKG